MNSRYLSNVALVIAGAFLVVASPGVRRSDLRVADVRHRRDRRADVGNDRAAALAALAQRGLDALIGILGAWTVVASLVFVGSTVIWLGFASGAGLVALAVIGLTLHELTTERVVHSFEVTTATEREFAHVG